MIELITIPMFVLAVALAVYALDSNFFDHGGRGQ